MEEPHLWVETHEKDKCLTSVIDAIGGVLRSRRSWRQISARIVDAIVWSTMRGSAVGAT